MPHIIFTHNFILYWQFISFGCLKKTPKHSSYELANNKLVHLMLHLLFSSYEYMQHRWHLSCQRELLNLSYNWGCMLWCNGYWCTDIFVKSMKISPLLPPLMSWIAGQTGSYNMGWQPVCHRKKQQPTARRSICYFSWLETIQHL